MREIDDGLCDFLRCQLPVGKSLDWICLSHKPVVCPDRPVLQAAETGDVAGIEWMFQDHDSGPEQQVADGRESLSKHIPLLRALKLCKVTFDYGNFRFSALGDLEKKVEDCPFLFEATCNVTSTSPLQRHCSCCASK